MIKEKKSATSYILGLLARQEYTEFDLRKKLKQKFYTSEEANQAINTVQELNYQSDYRYTTLYVKSKTNSGHGYIYLKHKLHEKGVSDEILYQVLEELNLDWSQITQDYLHSYLRKNIHKVPPLDSPRDLVEKFKNKVYGHFMTRGFRSEDISLIMHYNFIKIAHANADNNGEDSEK